MFFVEYGVEAPAKDGETLLDVIREAGLPIEAVCAGRGTCGKCLVRVDGVEGLACKTPAEDGMRVEILAASEGQEILVDSVGGGDASGDRRSTRSPAASADVSIAIDVGTTTVVVKAVDVESGEELGVRAFTNPQRAYGADVLSRINESMDDASLLSGLIRESLDSAIRDLMHEIAPPRSIVIAGNTTMSYLLLGLRCRSLGLAPFEPEYGIKPVYDYAEVFGTDTFSCPVYIYPYVSAFVGGDIVSGFVNIERHLETGEAPSYMLVDMGTNGEIAYRGGERMFTTSTAAGPALEGGNIEHGMSGLPGAIYQASYEGDGKFSCKTIGDKPAIGICGSGVISLMAALLDGGLVSESGAFTDEAKALCDPPAALQIAGDIAFTQKDVREFQLAKGAIRAGIDILVEEMGETPQTLYMAGGFGQNIDLDAAFRVGLIPRALEGRIRFIGNSSLGGCVDACLDPSPDPARPYNDPARQQSPTLHNSISAATEINLGSHPSFNTKFMDAMMFDNQEAKL